MLRLADVEETTRERTNHEFAQFAVVVSPIALGGLTQLVGWRESTWELRIATGLLFGIASGWCLYPRLFGAERTVTPQDSRELASR
jgi:predicted membrane protein DUF2085